MSCAFGSRVSRMPDAWSQRWRANRQAEWELSARHPHKRGDPGREVRQLAVAFGAEILKKGVQSMSAFVRIADSSRTSRHVRFVPILLQKSVEGFREQ
jgi:hypothetical protein